MAKKKNTTKTGNESMRRFVELRKSQGYLSFVRARYSRFGECDLWGVFDIFSMNRDGIELAQIKTASTRDTCGALKKVALWIQENRAMIPPGTNFVVAVWVTPEERFYVREIDWE